MPQVIDLRPDFGNDFARIFMEKEQLSLAKERQKLLEQQTKYENEQKELAIQRAQSHMQGQTAGIMQSLLGTPQGQQLLGQAAQPYADAFKTFFGGNATPEQLGLSPQGVASGIAQSPEPYAAAGFATALKDQEQQKYERGFAEEGREIESHRFDRTMDLQERKAANDLWLGEQNLKLREAQMQLQKNNADRAAHLQGFQIVTEMQDRVRAAWQADLAYRINGLGEDARTAYQRASLTHYGAAAPPDAAQLSEQAHMAMDALGRGVPISMVGRMALGDGADPLRQLANMGLDERVVDAIARGYEAGEDPYNMYKDVHEVLTARRDGLSGDQKDAIRTQTGMSHEDYFAHQLNTFTTWFAENYPEDDPARLVKIYRNSLADPDASAWSRFDLGEEESLGKFLWSALTVWDAKSTDEEREQAQEVLSGVGQLPEGRGSTTGPSGTGPAGPLGTELDLGALPIRGRPSGIDTGLLRGQTPPATPVPPGSAQLPPAGGAPAGPLPYPVSSNQLAPQSTPSPITALGQGPVPGAPLQDYVSRWSAHGEADAPATAQEFGQFLWEVLDVWGGNAPRRPNVAPPTPAPAPPAPTMIQSILGGGQAPGLPEPDSFRAPTGGTVPSGPVAVPGWVNSAQAQQYQDTAQLLRSAGIEEDTVQMMLELNFKPRDIRPGRSPINLDMIY